VRSASINPGQDLAQCGDGDHFLGLRRREQFGYRDIERYYEWPLSALPTTRADRDCVDKHSRCTGWTEDGPALMKEFESLDGYAISAVAGP